MSYVMRADNVLMSAAVYFDSQTVTVEAWPVVTYDGQARVVEQVDSAGAAAGVARRADDRDVACAR
jgi:hypothetical protein